MNNELKATIYVVRIKEKDELESSYRTWYENQNKKCFDVISHPQYDFVVVKSLNLKDSDPLYINKDDCLLLGEVVSSEGHIKCIECNEVFSPGYKRCTNCCLHEKISFKVYSPNYIEFECLKCGYNVFNVEKLQENYILAKRNLF